MRKKVILILTIFLFIFFITSCRDESFCITQDIAFAISTDKTGKISQEISFPTQEDSLGLSGEEKNKYINELKLELKSKLFFPYFVNFYATSVASGKEEYRLGGDKISYDIPFYSQEEKCISFSFNFENSDVWNFFHDLQDDKEGLNIEKGVFLNKGKSKNEFIFSQMANFDGKQQTLGEYFCSILNTVQSKYVDKTVLSKLSSPKLSYVYSVATNKIHTNADKKFQKDGLYVNVWQNRVDELSRGKSVEIYVYGPNKAVWYIFALGLTIAAMLAIFVLQAIKKKKRGFKN